MITIELHMEPSLRAALADAPRLIESALTDALMDAGMEIANDARPRTPYLTGSLRRSIQARQNGDGTVSVGSELPYAARIEYGFRGTDSRGRSFNQSAQPYLRPAFDENRARVRQAMADALVDALRRIR